jgi:hypothetical protein
MAVPRLSQTLSLGLGNLIHLAEGLQVDNRGAYNVIY